MAGLQKMSTPFTLDNAIRWGVQLAPPQSGMQGRYQGYLDLPVPQSQWMRTAAGITPYANDRIDIRAPGIRDQIPRPPVPYFGQPRDSLFDTQGRTNNKAPFPNYNDEVPSFLMSRENQEWHAAMYQRLRETKDAFHFSHQERGQFPVPYTGFSAFRDLHPVSTHEEL